ncbi:MULTISPECIES: transglycosylase family protein [Streptomyces]|uniref:Transglycosylase SLT domain-containing protein n=1 Tax=Streptomyces lycii TaxID=2654337 RepID=A0ABQ7FFY9_9ACTN|nr:MULTISPECIES: transglycosylase family protein [Streptomyces]KAF4407507.1 transglycosylase SLT domain-containing protein [Streptomyces lycii]PGH52193.1 peptidase [Streptomyces sp. Ru87]
MARGRHRRPNGPLNSRNLSRLVLTAGGAGLAAPLFAAGTANAAPVSVWDKVAECESSGNWSSNTGNGFYGGLQFQQSSWEAVGGTEYAERADLATKDQQIAAAEKLLAQQGPTAWPSCGPAAGLQQDSGAPDIDTGSGDQAEQGAKKPAEPAQDEKSGKKPAATGSYTVAAGDTLHRIAVGHDVEGGWETVYEANRETVGDNPHLIFPGQKLTLAAQQSESGKTGEADKSAGGAEKSGEPESGAQQAASQSYPDNLDGWIREALDIMSANGIPGTYEGIHRNIMRESGGDPSATNNWDINAQNGTPSIGLLQVIKPTFDAYHVEGTANDQSDPVANIVAACNYAADVYGSIDNVNGPY